MASADTGQMSAHTAQLMHAAGRGSQGTGPSIARQSVGQRSQHKPQPVQARSSRTGISSHFHDGWAGFRRLRWTM